MRLAVAVAAGLVAAVAVAVAKGVAAGVAVARGRGTGPWHGANRPSAPGVGGPG